MTWTVKMTDARYDGYEEGFDEGFTAGREDGLQQGAYQKTLEMARKLIARGDSLEEIADISGLSMYQVQSLISGLE
ncbi:MAG: hypothetical protein IKW26_11215 [Treponema sp.]|nr:hypothetical protein [Treponema sp.]